MRSSTTETRAASAADKKAARIAVAKAKADATKQAAAEVEVEGKQLAGIVKRMRAMELGSGKLMDEATDELRKADTLRAEISKRIAAVKPKCKAAGMSFKDFQKQYCPDYSRTAIYRMLAIGHSPDPDAAVEAERQAERERKAEAAAKNRPGNPASGTSDVRLGNDQPLDTSKLSPAAQEQLARVTGNGVDPEASKQDRGAVMAKLAGEEPPTQTTAEPVENFEGEEDDKPLAVSVMLDNRLATTDGLTPWALWLECSEHLASLMNVPTREGMTKEIASLVRRLTNNHHAKKAA
jgi:hypothetical protein